MAEKKQKSTLVKSIYRIIPLAIILVFVVILIKVLQSNGVPIGFSSTWMNPAEDYRKLKLFTEEQKDSRKKKNAGLYEAFTYKNGYQIKDRLEVKDNGIIWQVRQYTLIAPNHDTSTFMHVRTAYINPYGCKDTSLQALVNEVNIIQQASACGKDTCYGRSKVDEIWHTEKHPDSTLTIEDITYTVYHGDLDTFFPPNATSVPHILTLSPCSVLSDFASYTRSFFKKKFSTPTVETTDPLQAITLITTYYEPLFLQPVMKPFLVGHSKGSDSLVYDFTIGADGKPLNVALKNSKIMLKRFEEAIQSEIGTWVYPQPRDKKSCSVSYVVYF